MLDIRVIRDSPDDVKAALKNRGGDVYSLIDDVLAIDEQRRKLETERQQLQGDRKRESKQIGALKGKGEDTSEIEAKVREIGDRIKAIGEEADAADQKQRDLLLQIPNTPHAACPIGADETANPEVKVWGEKPDYDFELKDHVELATDLGLLDFENAAKISGSGFVVFKGKGAKLERALIQFLLDLHTTEHGYTEVSPPFIIQRECMFGTSQLPKFEEDMYSTEDSTMFLAPTAEVPVTNLERETLHTEDNLPIRYAAYTPCFRREAGASGRDNKGLIRVHQFDKVELVHVVKPETSFEVLEELLGHAEKVLQLLGLHYRIIELCTGDIGFGATKCYDIEVWAPGQGQYLEVSSCSNFADYQARRMNLRFKDTDGKNRMCHTLNGSGTALPRLYVALLETYQQADGSVKIPEALQKYVGFDLVS
ncbi:MAG: serine--tRNA ligase [Verrucomicrobiota bacterium]